MIIPLLMGRFPPHLWLEVPQRVCPLKEHFFQPIYYGRVNIAVSPPVILLAHLNNTYLVKCMLVRLNYLRYPKAI